MEHCTNHHHDCCSCEHEHSYRPGLSVLELFKKTWNKISESVTNLSNIIKDAISQADFAKQETLVDVIRMIANHLHNSGDINCIYVNEKWYYCTGRSIVIDGITWNIWQSFGVNGVEFMYFPGSQIEVGSQVYYSPDMNESDYESVQKVDNDIVAKQAYLEEMFDYIKGIETKVTHVEDAVNNMRTDMSSFVIVDSDKATLYYRNEFADKTGEEELYGWTSYDGKRTVHTKKEIPGIGDRLLSMNQNVDLFIKDVLVVPLTGKDIFTMRSALSMLLLKMEKIEEKFGIN